MYLDNDYFSKVIIIICICLQHKISLTHNLNLMKKEIILTAVTGLTMLLGINQANAQLVDGHAYMFGNFVEIGINANGHEGAPIIDLTDHSRNGGGMPLFGFVADPAESDWTEYNGDFFVPGTPENGFGVTFTLLGVTDSFSNNAVALNEIPGEIISFEETVDSSIVIWQGAVGDLSMTLKYELEKSQHYYRTSVLFENTGLETYTDVYYYRNVDPDNNMPLGAGYSTLNKIISQTGDGEDSCIVRATQTIPWLSELIFSASGENWKCFIGGFYNRNGASMWNGVDLWHETGDEALTDGSIGLAYKIDVIPPGKAASEWFSFTTSFKSGIQFGEPNTSSIVENNLNFELYPNPTTNNVITLNLIGTYSFEITDTKGSIVLNGNGNGINEIDLSGVEKGIYFINIQQENQSATTKLVVN